MPSSVRSAPRSAFVLSLLMLTAFGTGCSKKESVAEEASETKTPTAGEAVATPALTDANVASIVLIANKMDIENANMALGKTKNASVIAFANQMIVDHGSVNQQTTDLAKKLSLKPEDEATGREFEENADATRKNIKEADGAAFDKAYIDNEVAYHQAVLDMLDKTLIPAAADAGLKSFLEGVRPAFVAHLDHAKHVQAALPS